jgi:hypothetical protein
MYQMIECKIVGDRATVAVPQSIKMLLLSTSLEGRRVWLKGGGLSIDATRHNLDKLKAGIPGLFVTEELKPTHVTSRRRFTYEPVFPPMQHQHRCLDKMWGLGQGEDQGARSDGNPVTAFAVFADVGTGKSKISIDFAGQLFSKGIIDAMIVIAPKGVHEQWVYEQLPTHYQYPINTILWPFKGDFNYTTLNPNNLTALCINWEAVRTERGIEAMNNFIAYFKGRILLVADESHRIKNKESATWDAAEKLGNKCSHKIAMTGTPIGTNLLDEWAQICWLDEDIIGIRYKKSFTNEYLILGGYDGDQIVGVQNMDRFRKLVDPHTFSITREGMGHPPPVRERWSFHMTKRQREMIREIKEDLVTQIDTGELMMAANAAVAFLRMQQISNGFIVEKIDVETQIVHPIFPKLMDNPRIAAMGDYVDNHPGKLIIWARFRDDIKFIAEFYRLTGRKFVEYHGGIDSDGRRAAVQGFMQGDAQGFLATTATGGTGLNLQGACNYDLFYSSDDNFITRTQAEGRIDRIGSKGLITHTDLFARASMDGRILSRHRTKALLTEMSIGDLRTMLVTDDEEFEKPIITADNWS